MVRIRSNFIKVTLRVTLRIILSNSSRIILKKILFILIIFFQIINLDYTIINEQLKLIVNHDMITEKSQVNLSFNLKYSKTCIRTI